MISRKARALREQNPEYSVYIYHKSVQQNDSTPYPMDWERRHKTFSLRSALRNAERLYNSRAYDRVEVRKVSFNKRLQRRIDKQLKIYKKRSDKPVGMLIAVLVIMYEGLGCMVVGITRAYVSLRASLSRSG